MGLFSKKPIYKYKPLQKYKVDIEYENEVFKKSDPWRRGGKYKLLGETSKYRIYYFLEDSSSSTYLLRQDKDKTNKVVYLGRGKTNMCIFNNKLFAIDRINCTSRTYHPLYCTDVETGICTEINVLSDKGCYFAMHFHCQDCVDKISANDDTLIMQVTRYKESSHAEEEYKYQVCLKYDGNTLLKECSKTSIPNNKKTSKNNIPNPVLQKNTPDNKDISYSNETPISHGNYNVYGKDIALKTEQNKD